MAFGWPGAGPCSLQKSATHNRVPGIMGVQVLGLWGCGSWAAAVALAGPVAAFAAGTVLGGMAGKGCQR